jgi:hypothetical protein
VVGEDLAVEVAAAVGVAAVTSAVEEDFAVAE